MKNKRFLVMSLCMLMVILVISAIPAHAGSIATSGGKDVSIDVIAKAGEVLKDAWHWLTTW